jgi:hypothetical protein
MLVPTDTTPVDPVVAKATPTTGVWGFVLSTVMGAVPETLVTSPAEFATHSSPVEQAELAAKMYPLLPTGNAVGVPGADATTISPFVVRIEQGIAGAPAFVQRSAVPVEERSCPAVPVDPEQSQMEVTLMSPGVSIVPPVSKRTSPT